MARKVKDSQKHLAEIIYSKAYCEGTERTNLESEPYILEMLKKTRYLQYLGLHGSQIDESAG